MSLQDRQQAGDNENADDGMALAALRAHPQFEMLRRVVQHDPTSLGTILTTMSAQNPQLFALISENQDEFVRMLLRPSGASSSASSSAAAAVDPKKKATKVPCLVCGEQIDEDHTGVKCKQGHHVCPVCCPNFVGHVMGDLTTNYKCSVCHVELVALSFERQLNEKQRAAFLTYLATKEVGEGEYLLSCPFCPYFEVHLTCDGKPQFFFCKNTGHRDGSEGFGGVACGKASCGVCLKEVRLMDEADQYLDEDAYEAKLNHEEHGMGPHMMECGELAAPLARAMQALEEGEKVACPHCGFKGRKDDACTHMTCPNCSGLWCYMCAKKKSECDGAKTNNWGEHNERWVVDGKRCPWFLHYIKIESPTANQDWPDDSEAAVAHYHRLRTLRMLREAFDELGEAMWDRLCARYGAVRNCGYSKAEIVAFDAKKPMIQRVDDGDAE